MNKSTMKRYKYFDDYDQEYSFDSLTKVLTKQEITGFVEYLIKEKVSFTLAMIDTVFQSSGMMRLEALSLK